MRVGPGFSDCLRESGPSAVHTLLPRPHRQQRVASLVARPPELRHTPERRQWTCRTSQRLCARLRGHERRWKAAFAEHGEDHSHALERSSPLRRAGGTVLHPRGKGRRSKS